MSEIMRELRKIMGHPFDEVVAAVAHALVHFFSVVASRRKSLTSLDVLIYGYTKRYKCLIVTSQRQKLIIKL